MLKYKNIYLIYKYFCIQSKFVKYKDTQLIQYFIKLMTKKKQISSNIIRMCKI